MLKLRPLAGYILVEVIDEQGVRESGFVEPESSKEKPAKGKVLEVGPDEYMVDDGKLIRKSFKPELEKGQTVVFKRWQGQDIREDGKDLKFVEFKDIMGVYG